MFGIYDIGYLKIVFLLLTKVITVYMQVFIVQVESSGLK